MLFNRTIEVLKELDWPYEIIQEQDIITFNYQGDHDNTWPCFIHPRNDKHQIIVYSFYPLPIPPEKHDVLVKYITLANLGLPVGNFEFDYDDGSVRFKAGHDFSRSEVFNSQIEQLIVYNLSVSNTYFPGFFDILYSELSPSEILQKVEEE